MFIPYAFTRIGPNLAKVPLANPFVKALATKAAPKVPMILFFSAITLVCIPVRAPDILPLNAVCIACAAPVDWDKDNAVPNSIADTLKLFFALRRGALRLATMYPTYYNRLLILDD